MSDQTIEQRRDRTPEIRDPTDGFRHADPVGQIDGAPCLNFALGGQQILLRGTGRGPFLPGWRALFLFTGFAPYLVLQLAHESGARAVWYLCSEGNRLADRIAGLKPDDRASMLRAAAPIVSRLVASVLQEPHPRLLPLELDFLALDENCRADILSHCREAGALQNAPLAVLPLPAVRLHVLANAGGRRQPVMLPHGRLADLLGLDLQDRLPDIAANGCFMVPSPATGRPLQCQGSLCLDDFHFAYRFAEPGGLVFYLIAGHEHSMIYGLYLPRSGMLLCAPGKEGPAVASRQFLPDALAHHVVMHADRLVPYLAAPKRGVTAPLRAPPWSHIGHQLWNELSGIERFLAASGPAGTLPEWVVPDGERPVEFYGPIDDLFPRLRGHVRRGLRHAADLIDYAYAHGRLVIRATNDRVSADMRRRLLAYADSCADSCTEPPGSEAIRCPSRISPFPQAGPLLLLGLRVENRTLTDLGGFYGRLITAVRRGFPDARFVLDGHNVASADGRKHRSHGEHDTIEAATIAVERAILAQLRAQHGDGVVISAVGLTLPENLRLIARCDGFVSPWGAGLAKYRWACNRTGYVMTSRWNLEHRADRRIYDMPQFMEDPVPMRWIPAAWVTDLPESPVLVMPRPEAQWMNFSIDEPAVVSDILDFVEALMTVPGMLSGAAFRPATSQLPGG